MSDTEAQEYALNVAAQLQAVLTPDLTAVVLIGSLAHGGFSSRFSDIDIAAIFHTPVEPEAIALARATIDELGPSHLSKRVSLFYAVMEGAWGRMEAIDRVDLCDHGRVVWGTFDNAAMWRPSLEDVRKHMWVQSIPTWKERVQRFSLHPPAGDLEFKHFLRTLLYPARLSFSWRTGQVGSNEEAVEYYLEQCPSDEGKLALQHAIECRNGRLSDSELLLERPSLKPLHAATVSWLKLGEYAQR